LVGPIWLDAVSETSTRHFLPDLRCSSVRCNVAARDFLILIEDTAMITGTVKFYNGAKGFGFIQPADGGKDVFVHVSALERAGIASLSEGQTLQFDLEEDKKGRNSAANLRLS
jgi:CspA family cold shock protein